MVHLLFATLHTTCWDTGTKVDLDSPVLEVTAREEDKHTG